MNKLISFMLMLSLVSCFACTKDNHNKNNSISRTRSTSTTTPSTPKMSDEERNELATIQAEIYGGDTGIICFDGSRFYYQAADIDDHTLIHRYDSRVGDVNDSAAYALRRKIHHLKQRVVLAPYAEPDLFTKLNENYITELGGRPVDFRRVSQGLLNILQCFTGVSYTYTDPRINTELIVLNTNDGTIYVPFSVFTANTSIFYGIYSNLHGGRVGTYAGVANISYVPIPADFPR
jgi:hypothetical protein